ncbi:hypothetical protein QBC37DRAFT_243882, partial [Rhypophila decipiens]
TSWTGRKPSSATTLLWHGRLGHPGAAALANLPESSTGVVLRGPAAYECPDSGMAKARRQTRRTPREITQNVGEVIAIDFLD